MASLCIYLGKGARGLAFLVMNLTGAVASRWYYFGSGARGLAVLYLRRAGRLGLL